MIHMLFNDYEFASVLSRAIFYSCFDVECYFTLLNMDWLVIWTLLHAFRGSTFSLLLAQKIQQVKTFFPTPSTKVFPVTPPYLPLSFMLFQVFFYHVILCYLHF